jgi:hypothetical protein
MQVTKKETFLPFGEGRSIKAIAINFHKASSISDVFRLYRISTGVSYRKGLYWNRADATERISHQAILV